MKRSNIVAVLCVVIGAASGAVAVASIPKKPVKVEVEKTVVKFVPKETYGVNLSEYQDIDFPVFTYDAQWMDDYSDKFAYKFDKTLYICDKKYSYILDKTSDLSTDYGSKVLEENRTLVKLCVDETLKNEESVDEDDRTGGRDMSQDPNNFKPE